MSTIITIILTCVITEIICYIRFERKRKTIAVTFSDNSSNRKEFDDIVINFYSDDTSATEEIRDRMVKMVKESLDSEDILRSLGYTIIFNDEQIAPKSTMKEITEPKNKIVDKREENEKFLEGIKHDLDVIYDKMDTCSNRRLYKKEREEMVSEMKSQIESISEMIGQKDDIDDIEEIKKAYMKLRGTYINFYYLCQMIIDDNLRI